MKIILTFINFLIFFITIKCDTEDKKFYFQLYPSQDKDKPYLIYAYTPPSNLMTINSTEKENCTIIDNSEINESAIKNLSSVITYKDLIIKTCFNPDILVEIKNDYVNLNKKKSKILSNVKYCYSTVIYSPNNTRSETEDAIITYWIEYELKSGKEIFTHKSMIYYIKKNIFSEEIILRTTKNFYSEKCINLRSTDIFCSISSDEFTYVNYFVIETSKLFSNDNNHLVSSNVAYEKDVYQKIIGADLALKENLNDIFIIENHNKIKKVTKLIFQLYKKGEKKASSLKDGNELIIEKTYIEPSIFNMLFQKTNDTIVSYIMKAGKKNNYLLSRFNLTESIEKKNSSHLVSNYLYEDICSEPKYMQTNYITSFINYNELEKYKIRSNGEKNYYKYEKDIVSLITCMNGANKVEYIPKKIILPQCLNILDELNNKSYHVIEFTQDINRVDFDIINDPNYKSLKNVIIQFFPGETDGNIVINYKERGADDFAGYGEKDFNKTLRNIAAISFTRTSSMKTNKNLTLKYRLMKTDISRDNKTYACHLSSDICELNFIFKKNSVIPISPGTGGTDDRIEEQEECKEYNNIEGIILNQCICDAEKGFKEEPDLIKRICVCKEGYSYYKDRKECLPNDYLKECKCYLRKDDLSLIPIYDDCPEDKTIIEEDGKCIVIHDTSCFNMSNLDLNLWFKLGEYKFYYAKINDCVYIFDGQNLTLFFYSNREDCSFENDIMIRFIRECLNKPEITGVKEYMAFLNSAKEYEPNATDITIFKKIEKKDSKIKSIFFNLVNGQSQENVSDVILPEHIINEVKNISNISEELNLLVFKADMTRNDTISTQVEYQFYNPIPSKIHQKIIFKSLNDTNSRRLDDDGLGIEMETNKFDVKLNLPIQWKEDELKIIDEAYKKKHIFIFDSSNPFYLDVCYKYTTAYNADIYLQDRKEKYYIQHPFCEEGCILIDDHNYDSNKLTCQCSAKNINDNYTNITFCEIEPADEFKEEYNLPNFKVMGCIREVFYENFILKNPLFYINLAILLVFILSYVFQCKKYNPFKKLIDKVEKKLSELKGNDDETEEGDNNNNENPVEEEIYTKEIEEEKERQNAYDDEYNPFIKDKGDEDKSKESINVQNESQPKRTLKNKQIGKEKVSNSTNNLNEKEILGLKQNKKINEINEINEQKYEKDMQVPENSDEIKEDQKINNNSKNIGIKEKNNSKELIDEDQKINNDSQNIENKEKNTTNELIDEDQKINNNSQNIDIKEKNNSDADQKKNNDSQNIDIIKSNNSIEFVGEVLNINNDFQNNNIKENNNENQLIDDDKNANNETKNIDIKDKKNKELIDDDKNANNDSQKIDIKDNNNNKELIEDDKNPNNDSQKNDIIEDNIENLLIEDDHNDSQNNGIKKSNNKNQLIEGDKASEQEKSVINKKDENIYEADSVIDLESRNSIQNNSNQNDFFNKKILDHSIYNSKSNANPPKRKGEEEEEDEFEDESQSKNTENSSKTDYTGIHGDEEKSDARMNQRKKKFKNVYEKLKTKFLGKIIHRIEYEEALEGDKKTSFCGMFGRMIVNNNTLFFVFNCCDENDFRIKVTVGVLSICLYIFVNILIMIKAPSLHLYRRKDNGKFNPISFFINLFFPYIIFYFSILKLKMDLSIKEFINEQYYQYYKILSNSNLYNKNNKKKKNNKIDDEKEKKDQLLFVKSKGKEKINEKENDNNENLIENEKKDTNMNKDQEDKEKKRLILAFHNLEAKISKKKNEYQKEKSKLFFGGIILIVLNWYYMSCFLGIYENSYDCLFVNLLVSVGSSFFISHMVYLISTSFRYCGLKKNSKCLFTISEFLNPQNKYFCCKKLCSCFYSVFFFKCISAFCSKVFCCCYNEKEIEEYIEERRREYKNKKKKDNKNKSTNANTNANTNTNINTKKNLKTDDNIITNQITVNISKSNKPNNVQTCQQKKSDEEIQKQRDMDESY